MNYIRPDQVYEIPIQGGVLMVSPSCDIMHHFRNGAWMLKYWDVNHEPPRMCNVFMPDATAAALVDMCDLEVLDRKYMGAQEHEQWVGWSATYNLLELDFVPEEEGGENTL